MITKAIFCGRMDVSKICQTENPANHLAVERYAAISIHDPGGKPAAYPSWIRPILPLGFTDFSPNVLWTPTVARNHPYIILFTKEQAQKIIIFVHSLLRAKDKYTVIVNCEAGVSRSAAVAKFIHFAAEITEPTTGPMKKVEHPNELVSKLLLEEWSNALHGIVHAKKHPESGVRG